MNLQVTFRNMPTSESLTSLAESKAQKLAHLCDRIVDCEVLIERASNHHNKGRPYHVRVRVGIPGNDIVVGRDPGDAFTHEDARTAIRDAFKTAARRVADYAGRTRHHQPGRGAETIRRVAAAS
jgi:ribosome-associated translation inhibitor RaiA